MKRILLIAGSALLTILVSAMLNRETRAVRVTDAARAGQTREIADEIVRLKTERAALHQTVVETRWQTPRSVSGAKLNPRLADWLLAGKYGEIPRDLAPELRSALGFPWNDSPDAVLISKSALRDLTLRSVVGNGKLSPALCALLSITPEEKAQVESAMTQTREQFLDWAKSNLQREGASGDTLVKYTIPAAPEFSASLTNQLYAAFQNAVGAERTGLLNRYTADWQQFDVGFLGASESSLRVFRQTGSDGKSELYYEVKRGRNGPYGETGEKGRVNPDHFHPTFRALFPGGWPEVFQREGLELPAQSM